MKRNLYKQAISLLILVNMLFGVVDAFGQRRRGTAAPAKTVSPKAEKQQGCNGGWSGVVTLTKTLKESLESDEPGIRKAMDRIKHKTSRDYVYTGRAVVDSSDPMNPVVNTKIAFSDNDLSWGQEKVFDTCNSRENGHWFIIEGTDDRQTQAQAAGPARSFNLTVDEGAGRYSFNIGLPDANGTFKREEHTKRTGHCQPKNNEPYDRSTNEPVKVDGESFSIDSERLDPNDPDHISGSKTWGDDGKGQVRTFIYQATWRFTRCPGKLLITDLKFEHPKFPNFEDWQEIPETIGTIDGNRVKVKATVLNLFSETKYADLKVVETFKGDKWNGSMPDKPLPNGESSLRLEAGEEKEVEFIWDSEGESWFDDGRPHLLHRLKAELTENGQKKDEKEKRLEIAPKPLVLVHGLWSDFRVWEPLYQNLLTAGHSYQWKAYPVGEKPTVGAMSMGRFMGGYSASLYDNADHLARYVKYAQEQSNAWHVDMVAHNMGGLVARLYIHKSMPNVPDARPLVKHLTMLGTPNGGVPCVDVFVGKLDVFKKELKATRELTNDEMLRFNQYVVNTGGTKFSARAGNPVPIVCGGLEWNDGFVTVKSATYGVADKSEANDLNLQLTNGKNFGDFVKPHIVTGPKGTYPLPVKSDPTDWRKWQVSDKKGEVRRDVDLNGNRYSPDRLYASLFETAEYAAGHADAEPVPLAANGTFAKELTLPSKQAIEVEFPVDPAPSLGFTFLAAPGVSASLVDDRGIVVSSSTAGSEFAGSMFRMLLAPRAVAGGTWRLRIVNTTDEEQLFAGFSWSMDNLPVEITGK